MPHVDQPKWIRGPGACKWASALLKQEDTWWIWLVQVWVVWYIRAGSKCRKLITI